MRLRFVLLLPVLLFLLPSCENRLPDGIIEEERMEDLLYDYHMAKALGDRTPGDADGKAQSYTVAVCRKHGVTEADFERSMRYYARHADILYGIYENLNKRFAGSTRETSAGFRPLPATGDTAEIWQGSASCLLSSVGNNRMEFKQDCDTSYHAGDKLIWSFSSRWIYKEGMKSAAMVLAIRYEGDSVASVSRGVYSTGRQELTIAVGNRKPLSVYGMVYQQAPWAKTTKLLLLSDFSMVKFRPFVDRLSSSRPDTVPPRPEGDSASRRFRDSIQGLDSANRRRPHFKEIGGSGKPAPVARFSLKSREGK